MQRERTSIAAVLVSAAVALGGGRAAAFEKFERRIQLGGTFGFAALSGGPTSLGLGGGAIASFDLNDTFAILGSAHLTAHPYGQWLIASGGVGVAYLIDTARVTPWVGATAGPAAIVSTDALCGASISEPCAAFRLNLEIPFGIDYQLTRRLSVGAVGRFQLLLLGENPWTTLGAYARVAYVWGR